MRGGGDWDGDDSRGGKDGFDDDDGEEEGTAVTMGLTLRMVVSASRCCCCCCIDDDDGGGDGDGCCGIRRLGCGSIFVRRCQYSPAQDGSTMMIDVVPSHSARFGVRVFSPARHVSRSNLVILATRAS